MPYNKSAVCIDIRKTKIRIPTAQEEKAIVRAALSDPDNPPLAELKLAAMKFARDDPDKIKHLKRLAAQS